MCENTSFEGGLKEREQRKRKKRDRSGSEGHLPTRCTRGMADCVHGNPARHQS